MFDQARELIDAKSFPFSNVLYQPDWHKGVVGIVASKVVETRYRPTIVLTKSGDKLAGSARSVTDFDLYEALSACEEHLIQFGGHKYAAGMTLHESQLPHFKKAFEAYCQKNLRPEQLEQNLYYDAPAHLSQFTPRFYNVLKQFDPHGPENSAPFFCSKMWSMQDIPKRLAVESTSRFTSSSRTAGLPSPVLLLVKGKKQKPLGKARCLTCWPHSQKITIAVKPLLNSW